MTNVFLSIEFSTDFIPQTIAVVSEGGESFYAVMKNVGGILDLRMDSIYRQLKTGTVDSWESVEVVKAKLEKFFSKFEDVKVWVENPREWVLFLDLFENKIPYSISGFCGHIPTFLFLKNISPITPRDKLSGIKSCFNALVNAQQSAEIFKKYG